MINFKDLEENPRMIFCACKNNTFLVGIAKNHIIFTCSNCTSKTELDTEIITGFKVKTPTALLLFE